MLGYVRNGVTAQSKIAIGRWLERNEEGRRLRNYSDHLRISLQL